MKRRIFIFLMLLLLVFYIGTILYHAYKPLPLGISFEGKKHLLSDKDISFLTDLTYQEQNSKKLEKSIFPRLLQTIDEANEFIVLDFFLFNGYHNKGLDFPKVSEILVKKLIEKKKQNPHIRIIVISDEINTSYGSYPLKEFESLKKNGIDVILTDVDKLRDSTPLYSGIWRIFIKGFGLSEKGWLPNALADNAPKMTIRSYLKLLNIKANHRKTFATEKTAIIFSGNPSHNASANFSNTAFEIKGPIIQDVLYSEQAAIHLSNRLKVPKFHPKEPRNGNIQVQLLTEGKVYNHIQSELTQTKKGDEIWMAMFYIADRKIIHTLIDAANRGVNIYLILDPSNNAFGHRKHGLPNHPVAKELIKKGNGFIHIRWYKTLGEQFHPKLIFIQKDFHSVIMNGSTNLTFRNLADYNLETDVLIAAQNRSVIVKQVDSYFKRLWHNENGYFTYPYNEEKDRWVFLERGVYRLQELLQLTTY
ncbi:MAG: phospholipase D family protein [Heyndrickxia sp.]